MTQQAMHFHPCRLQRKGRFLTGYHLLSGCLGLSTNTVPDARTLAHRPCCTSMASLFDTLCSREPNLLLQPSTIFYLSGPIHTGTAQLYENVEGQDNARAGRKTNSILHHGFPQDTLNAIQRMAGVRKAF